MAKSKPPSSEVEALLAQVDEAFDRKSWHGTNLRGSLRQVSATQAAWRPARGRHNIWELTLHAAYWKYAVRRRLSGETTRGGFPLRGSNWFARPDGAVRDQDWQSDVTLLVAEHRRLRAAILEFDQAQLHEKTPRSKYTAAAMIRGVAAHDLYHAGQIQIVKRLLK
jgi:hypothetical protein